jgi:hypothetical protein
LLYRQARHVTGDVLGFEETMEIFVHAAESGNATQVRGYGQYRMFSAVSRYARRCARLHVRLRREDAIRRREQYSCSVVLDLVPAGRVRVRATGDRAYAAIDRAAERLSHGVEQRLGRSAHASGRGDRRPADHEGKGG